MDVHRWPQLPNHARSGFTWGTTIPIIANAPGGSTMFGEDHHDSIIRRGLDEALACRDLLAPAPPHRSALAELLSRWAVSLRARLRRLGVRSATSQSGSATASKPAKS